MNTILKLEKRVLAILLAAVLMLTLFAGMRLTVQAAPGDETSTTLTFNVTLTATPVADESVTGRVPDEPLKGTARAYWRPSSDGINQVVTFIGPDQTVPDGYTEVTPADVTESMLVHCIPEDGIVYQQLFVTDPSEIAAGQAAEYGPIEADSETMGYWLYNQKIGTDSDPSNHVVAKGGYLYKQKTAAEAYENDTEGTIADNGVNYIYTKAYDVPVTENPKRTSESAPKASVSADYTKKTVEYLGQSFELTEFPALADAENTPATKTCNAAIAISESYDKTEFFANKEDGAGSGLTAAHGTITYSTESDHLISVDQSNGAVKSKAVVSEDTSAVVLAEVKLGEKVYAAKEVSFTLKAPSINKFERDTKPSTDINEYGFTSKKDPTVQYIFEGEGLSASMVQLGADEAALGGKITSAVLEDKVLTIKFSDLPNGEINAEVPVLNKTAAHPFSVDTVTPEAKLSISRNGFEISSFYTREKSSLIYIYPESAVEGESGKELEETDKDQITVTLSAEDDNIVGETGNKPYTVRTEDASWTVTNTEKKVEITKTFEVDPDKKVEIPISFIVEDRAGNTPGNVDVPSNFVSYDASKGKIAGSFVVDRIRPSDETEGIPTITLTPVTQKAADAHENVPLYNQSVSYSISVKDPDSGLKSVSWIVGQGGTEAPFEALEPSQGFLGIEGETAAEETITFGLKDLGEYDNLVLKVIAEDNVGNKVWREEKLAIDTLAPRVTLNARSDAVVLNEKYFNKDRFIDVEVEDLFFKEADVPVTATSGEATEWNHDGIKHNKTCKYVNDADNCNFSMLAKDAAGNPAEIDYTPIQPLPFVIDKTAPVIAYSFTNTEVKNDKYYAADQTANIEITEHNFEAKDVVISVTLDGKPIEAPAVSEFKSNEDERTAQIGFTEDGDYSFTVDYTDLAGNPAEQLSVSEFTVNKTPPIIDPISIPVAVNSITDPEGNVIYYYNKELKASGEDVLSPITVSVTARDFDSEKSFIQFNLNDEPKTMKLSPTGEAGKYSAQKYSAQIEMKAGDKLTGLTVSATNLSELTKVKSDNAKDTYIVDMVKPKADIRVDGDVAGFFVSNGQIFARLNGPATGKSGEKAEQEGNQSITLTATVSDYNIDIDTNKEYTADFFVTTELEEDTDEWKSEEGIKINEDQSVTYSKTIEVAPDTTGTLVFNFGIFDLAGNVPETFTTNFDNETADNLVVLKENSLNGQISGDRMRPNKLDGDNPPIIKLDPNEEIEGRSVVIDEDKDIHLYHENMSYSFSAYEAGDIYSGLEKVTINVTDTQGLAALAENGSTELSFDFTGQKDSGKLAFTVFFPEDKEANDIKLTITASDIAGNTTTLSKTLAIDKQAPRVSIQYSDKVIPENDKYFSGGRDLTIVVEDLNFDNDTTKVNLTHDGVTLDASEFTRDGETNKYIFTKSFDRTAEGDYTFNMEATDKAGNKAGNGPKPEGMQEAYAEINYGSYINDEGVVVKNNAPNDFVIDINAPKVEFEIDESNIANYYLRVGDDNNIYIQYTNGAKISEKSGVKAEGIIEFKVTVSVSDRHFRNDPVNNKETGWELEKSKDKEEYGTETWVYTKTVEAPAEQTTPISFNFDIAKDLAGNKTEDGDVTVPEKLKNEGFKGRIFKGTTDPSSLNGAIIADRERPESGKENLLPVIKLTDNNEAQAYTLPSGLKLYPADMSYTLEAYDPASDGKYSGLDSIEWSVSDSQHIVTTTDGTSSKTIAYEGDEKAEVIIPINIPNGTETGDISLDIAVTDKAGNTILYNQKLAIDRKIPEVTITYTNNSVSHDKYFKDPRTLYVDIKDMFFNAGATEITTEVPVIGWQIISTDENNVNTYRATANYVSDGDYSLRMNTTDLAGNTKSHADIDYLNGLLGINAAPNNFTIDMTAPVINVTFDNNNVRNGKYYNADRTATVNIVEHNFLAAEVQAPVTAALDGAPIAAPGIGGFGSAGDSHSALIPFVNDGDYSFTVDYTDMAGNPAQRFTVPEFTIDKTTPQAIIGNVENMHAYQGEIRPTVTLTDVNFDPSGYNIIWFATKLGSSRTVPIEGNGVTSTTGHGVVFTFNDLPHIPENDGIYLLSATITDMAGNPFTTETVQYSVNRFGSVYTANNEQTRQLINHGFTNKAPALSIRETNANKLTNISISVAVNGTTKTLKEGTDFTISRSEPGDGWKQYTYNIAESAFKDGKGKLIQGNYVITIYSTDEAGNQNSSRTNVESNKLDMDFVIDNEKPGGFITVKGLGENKFRIQAASTDYTVTWEDNNLITKVEIYLNGQLVKVLEGKELEEAGGKYTLNVKEQNFTQSISATIYDAAGNKNELEEVTFFLNSSWFQQFIHNTGLLIGVIAGIVVIAGVIVAIVVSRRKKQAEEGGEGGNE